MNFNYQKVRRNGRDYFKHRVIWQEANGPIPDGMIIHHRNHDKKDNNLENLELMTRAQHRIEHGLKRKKRNFVCSIELCTNQAVCLQLCTLHYLRLKRNGDPNMKRKPGPKPTFELCRADSCKELAVAKHHCKHHYYLFQTYGPTYRKA